MKICEACNYPTEGDCGNPACPSNPSLSDEARAAIYARHEAAEAAKAEREMLARARAKAAEWGRK